MFKDLHFESQRIKTARLTEDDAAALLRIYSDREAMKYRGSKPLTDMLDALNMINGQFTAEDGVCKLRLGLRSKSSNELIGTLLLKYNESVKNKCEIGFSFGKEYWRRGYGRETIGMVEAKLSTQKSIEELNAWCIRKNIASVTLFEKAGFSEMAQAEYPLSKLFVKKINKLK